MEDDSDDTQVSGRLWAAGGHRERAEKPSTGCPQAAGEAGFLSHSSGLVAGPAFLLLSDRRRVLECMWLTVRISGVR